MSLTERKLRPPRPEDYPSRLHSERLAARVGLWLGAAFAICFVTGLFSHLIQHPPEWFGWPTRPVWLYRINQGVHITTGIASIPLLLVKLWTVSPRFWQWPPITSILNALERLSIFVLVGAAFFQLISGLLNVAEWYPWTFFFPPVHFAIAWVAIGALAVHIAVKLPVIRRALKGSADADPRPVLDGEPPATHSGPLSRRGVLALALAAAGVAVVATVGDKIPAFRTVSVLAQRNGSGPQGLPVNRTAGAAGVTAAVTSAAYALVIHGPGGDHRLSLAQLQAMPQITATLPIACVEGWSQSASWTGVRLKDLLALVDPGATGGARMISAEVGLYGESMVTPKVATDDLTLVALQLEGEPLDLDHGYPARLIAPSRPGALQTKWLTRIEAL
ncbi:hypothetical protein ABIB25_002025 [Nakamurella sp. UYEF19]|uniref:molybdopterin-dependent oxidoreductase n=1 Tax=Nakamurella sp. UYEF19 TaxID=1756392 RepID=UPI00339AAF05